MYFKKIDLHGFKSFAEPVSIVFHDGITCIVGPNGSGKSNISDAIRWVLGEQSPKMLRGGKMEEVIFAGTANRKSRGMAEVTLVIDNSSGILPIDYTEVAITRRMYRSGESEYSINNHPCRLKDIRELIMDTGIGVDGYSLIGQGKIADIVSSKPESRREIFEEAAGIVKYRSRKAEAERKLESTAHNLERVNDIIGEIESRIGGLQEDSEKATEYLALREQYKAQEINITLKNVESFTLKNEYLKDDLAEIENQIEQNRLDKISLEEQLREKRAEQEELEHTSNRCRDEILAIVEESNSFLNQSQLNQEKRENLDKDNNRLDREVEQLLGKIEKESAQERELTAKADEMGLALSALRNDQEEKAGSHAVLLQSYQNRQREIDGNKDRIFELYSTVNFKEAEIQSMRNLMSSLQRRGDEILGEQQISLPLNLDLQRNLNETQENLEQLQQEKTQREEELAQVKNTYAILQQQEKTLTRDLEDLKVTIGQVSTRKRMTEEMENSYEGYNNAVRFIMKSTSLRGIHGVVADLIQVPTGLEIAVETALGAALQNIVCEDDSCAQEAIQSLKANKAGRLTFLPLQSIRGSRLQQDSALLQADGFRGYGTDCISFDSKYREIMEYLLGRVVIVEKLEHAVRLSKKSQNGLRFVTLEGEVINASGAITGGTWKQNTGNLLERKAECKRLGDKLIQLENDKVEMTDALSSVKENLYNQNASIQETESRIRQFEMDLIHQRNQLDTIGLKIADQENTRQKWSQELANIEVDTASAQVMTDHLHVIVQEARERIKDIETSTLSIAGELESQKYQVDQASEAITEARLALAALEGEKANMMQLLERCQRDLEEMERDRTEKLLELENIRQLRGRIETEDGVLQKNITGMDEKKATAELELERNQNQKIATMNHINDLQTRKEAQDELLFGSQNQKYELQTKMEKNEAQIEAFKDKLWEEFEISYLQAIDLKKKDFVMATALRESKELKARIRALGEINIGSIKEYETVKERYEFLSTQKSDLLSAIGSLQEIISDMDRNIQINFKESFDQIAANFGESFQALFGGGTAELRLEDESNPLECGIEIVAQPPGKKLQNMNLLSGGEKTMTAIALMFSVLKAKPTPFCILDEVEAALDDVNIQRFASYLKNFKEIQFTLVTHQKATMEYADVLYGVTMPEQGISKVISLKLGDQINLS